MELGSGISWMWLTVDIGGGDGGVHRVVKELQDFGCSEGRKVFGGGRGISLKYDVVSIRPQGLICGIVDLISRVTAHLLVDVDDISKDFVVNGDMEHSHSSRDSWIELSEP